MRQSLMSTLLFLPVLAFAGQSHAQQTPASSPLPLIADASANETDRLRGLQLLNAKTVYLIVRLEPEAREGPKPGDRREKMARQSLDWAVYWETRLKAVKSRKDADLTFLLVEGNGFRDSHLVSRKKLFVFPPGPEDGNLPPIWESDWHEGEIDSDSSAESAVAEFRDELEKITPEMWIGAQCECQQSPDGPPALTPEERRDALISAKTVAVLSFGPLKRKGDIGDSLFFGNAPPWELADAARAQKDVEDTLRNWKRYSIAADPRDADLLLVITVWNEMAEKIDRTQHQRLISGLKVYRGRTLFGKPQQHLWSGVESAYTGRSTKHVVEHFRKDIEGLIQRSPEKAGLSP